MSILGPLSFVGPYLLLAATISCKTNTNSTNANAQDIPNTQSSGLELISIEVHPGNPTSQSIQNLFQQIESTYSTQTKLNVTGENTSSGAPYEVFEVLGSEHRKKYTIGNVEIAESYDFFNHKQYHNNTPIPTKYMSQKERNMNLLKIEDGKLKLASTNYEFRYIYVMDANGNMYVNSINTIELLHDNLLSHARLSGNKPVAAAGIFDVEDGKITLINNYSPEYKIGEHGTLNFITQLQKSGYVFEESDKLTIESVADWKANSNKSVASEKAYELLNFNAPDHVEVTAKAQKADVVANLSHYEAEIFLRKPGNENRYIFIEAKGQQLLVIMNLNGKVRAYRIDNGDHESFQKKAKKLNLIPQNEVEQFKKTREVERKSYLHRITTTQAETYFKDGKNKGEKLIRTSEIDGKLYACYIQDDGNFAEHEILNFDDKVPNVTEQPKAVSISFSQIDYRPWYAAMQRKAIEGAEKAGLLVKTEMSRDDIKQFFKDPSNKHYKILREVKGELHAFHWSSSNDFTEVKVESASTPLPNWYEKKAPRAATDHDIQKFRQSWKKISNEIETLKKNNHIVEMNDRSVDEFLSSEHNAGKMIVRLDKSGYPKYTFQTEEGLKTKWFSELTDDLRKLKPVTVTDIRSFKFRFKLAEDSEDSERANSTWNPSIVNLLITDDNFLIGREISDRITEPGFND